MSLARIHVRTSGKIARQGCRCFSSGRRDQNILDILGASQVANRNEPSKPESQGTPKINISRLARQSLPDAKTTSIQIQESEQRNNYSRQIFRKWNTGDVYAPHDLSGPEQKKWKTGRKTPQSDAFDTLGINPINEYKNFTMMSEYMTEMGRIKHSKDTGLRPVNQRKIAKAIRRAIGLGLMPSVHRHPLVLKKGGAARFRG